MSRRAAFKQADVERAVRALKAVGETVGAVDIRPDGSFRVLTGKEAANDEALSPLEAWEREHGHRAS